MDERCLSRFGYDWCVKYGVVFANTGKLANPDRAVTMAKLAEETGFDSLWAADHVFIPAGHGSPYPYSPDGNMPWRDTVSLPDPIVWLSYLAAVTEHIKLVTGVLVLSQRNPLITAKQAATLDNLSGGRLMLGVGVGWLREECEALGAPFDERGARLDEYIDIMREAWKGGETTFNGKFVQINKAIFRPTPARDTGIPIVIGGHSKQAARRAGRKGDGFFPAKITLDEIKPLIAIMKESAAEAGRDPAEIEVTAGGALDLDGVKAFSDAGVSRILLPVFASDEESLKVHFGTFHDLVMDKMSE